MIARSSCRVRQPEIVVRSSIDLSALHGNPIGPGRTRVVLCLSRLPQAQATAWEKELNLRFSECGCSAGTGLALLGLLAATLWQFVYADWQPLSWPGFLFRAIVAMMVAGVSGKLVAVEIARWRIRTLARHIQNHLA